MEQLLSSINLKDGEETLLPRMKCTLSVVSLLHDCIFYFVFLLIAQNILDESHIIPKLSNFKFLEKKCIIR